MKGLILSLEGVLVDHSSYYREVIPEIQNRHFSGQRVNSDEVWGLRFSDAWRDLCKNYLRDLPVRELKNEAEILFLELFERNSVADLPGASQFLENLRSLKIPYQVITMFSRDLLEKILKSKRLPLDSEAVLCEDEIFQGKPFPEIYLRATRQLTLEPAACIALDDSFVGLQAALEAGLQPMGIKLSDENFQNLSAAEDVFTDLDELPLEKWFPQPVE